MPSVVNYEKEQKNRPALAAILKITAITIGLINNGCAYRCFG